MRFEIAFQKTVIGHEGAYSNHPSDHGGETFYGISRKFHPSWSGWAIIDSYPLDEKQSLRLGHNLELAELVTEFYFETFWQPLHLSEINSSKVCCELFDSGVNAGVERVSRWLQMAVNLTGFTTLVVDGVIGPKTVSAVNGAMLRYGDDLLHKIMNGLQFEHYHALVERDPSQKVFLRGWLSRVTYGLA